MSDSSKAHRRREGTVGSSSSSSNANQGSVCSWERTPPCIGYAYESAQHRHEMSRFASAAVAAEQQQQRSPSPVASSGGSSSSPTAWQLVRSALFPSSSGRVFASSAASGLLAAIPTTSLGVRGIQRQRSSAAQLSHQPRHTQPEPDEAEEVWHTHGTAAAKEQEEEDDDDEEEQEERERSQLSGHTGFDGPRFHMDGEDSRIGSSSLRRDAGDDDEEHKDDMLDIELGATPTNKEPTTKKPKGNMIRSNSAPSAADIEEANETEAQKQRAKDKLQEIDDEDIRLILDPDSSVLLSEDTILHWSREKVIRLIQAFEAEHMEGMFRKIARGLIVAEGQAPLELSDRKARQAAEAQLLTSISWRNLYYSVNGTLLLQNVSGYVKPGQLVAVLGGPDAGITTLLDVLTRRAGVGGSSGGQMLGDIFVNRRAPDATFQRQVGYVAKTEVHLPELTVAESLYFSARLRNPHLSQRGALLRCALIMKMLGLLHTWSTPVGDDITRGISGGEKRRLSFGLELVAGHNLIVADLPTNGLDSASALSLIQVYKSTTLIGRSLLCSLVQPSPEIFGLLDLVLVLSKGATIYFGPPDLAAAYFASLGFAKPQGKSVPQFLEEISAAPEKFVSIDLAKVERPLGNGGGGESNNNLLARQSQRPLVLLRAQEKREKKLRQQQQQQGHGRQRALVPTRSFMSPIATTPASPVAATAASSGRTLNDNAPEAGGGAEIAAAASSAPSAASSNAAVLSVPSSSPPPPAANGAAGGAGAGAATVTTRAGRAAHARFHAWTRLVDGYSYSVFSDDVGFVLFHELTPVPTFDSGPARKQALAKQKASAEKRDKKRKARQAQATRNKLAGKKDDRQDEEEGEEDDEEDDEDEEDLGPNPAHIPLMDSSPNSGTYQTSFGVQYSENLRRLGTLFYRNKGLWLVNFLKSIGIGLLIGTLFYQLSLTQSNVRTRFGLFYFCLTFNCANAQQLVPVLLSYRRVFQLQKDGKYYRPLSYYLALVSVNVPIALIETFLFIVIVYPLAGLHGGLGSPLFGYAVLMLCMVNLVSRAWVIMLTSLMPTEALTNIMNGISLVVFSIFSGYLNPKSSIPPGWIWSYYISYFTWSLRGLLINEQLNLEYKCDANTLVPCQFPTGEAALELYDMSGDSGDKWLCILWMGLFLFCFNAIAAYSMTFLDLSAHDHDEEPDFRPVNIPREKQPRKIAAPAATNAAAGVAPDLEAALGTHAAQPADAIAKSENNSLLSPAGTPGLNVHGHANHGGFISWRNLNYTVPVDGPEGHRKLLHNVYGYATPGMMVALMGQSGAGKTTLLDVLAGKKTGGSIEGELLVNGLPRDEFFLRIAGYVEQFDSHDEHSTVREAVRFSAMLRLPASVTSDSAEVDRRVDRVLQQVGLARQRHDLIGNASTGGISQSARKKVTIAVEVIGEPRILFLDEPTTGLDSAGANDVLECVSALSASMAVICTIHQPSSELMQRFNFLCLLQNGGRTAYYGPLKDMPAYFHGLGLPKHREGDNLADYAIRCVKTGGGSGSGDAGGDDDGPKDKSLDKDKAKTGGGSQGGGGKKLNLEGLFKSSPGGLATLEVLQRGVASKVVRDAWALERSELLSKGHHGGVLAPFGLQFRLLLSRFSVGLLRSPDLWGGRIFAQILMAFIIGTCYFQLGHDQAAAQNRVSCLFLCVQFVMGSGALKLPAIFSERAVVFRERQAHMYSIEAYYLARWVHDWWLWILENFIFAVMVYFICNLTSEDHYQRFGAFYLLLLFTGQLGFSIAELIALLAVTPASAYALQGAVSTVFSLFSGFLISKANMPIGWSWAYYVSPNRYPLTASLQNELLGATFTCDPSVQFPSASPLCGLYDPTAIRCPLQCGEELLVSLGIDTGTSDETLNFGLIVVYVVGFKFLGYLAFKYIQHINR